MKNCNIVRELIPLYLDREASEETCRFIEQHLECCPECRNYLKESKRVPHSLSNKAVRGYYRYTTVSRRVRENRIKSMLLTVGEITAITALALTIGKRKGK